MLYGIGTVQDNAISVVPQTAMPGGSRFVELRRNWSRRKKEAEDRSALTQPSLQPTLFIVPAQANNADFLFLFSLEPRARMLIYLLSGWPSRPPAASVRLGVQLGGVL